MVEGRPLNLGRKRTGLAFPKAWDQGITVSARLERARGVEA